MKAHKLLILLYFVALLLIAIALALIKYPHLNPIQQARPEYKNSTAKQKSRNAVPTDNETKGEPDSGHTYNYYGTYHYYPNETSLPYIIFSTIAALLALGTLGAVAYQAHTAHTHLRTIERAWLAVIFDREFQLGWTNFKGVEFSVKNTGHSIAFIKAYKLRGMPWQNSIVPPRDLDPKPAGKLPTVAVVFPDQSVILEGPIGFNITQEMTNNINTGKMMFDVYGYVVYDDIFEQRHITRFCSVYNANTRTLEFLRDPTMGYIDAD